MDMTENDYMYSKHFLRGNLEIYGYLLHAVITCHKYHCITVLGKPCFLLLFY